MILSSLWKSWWTMLEKGRVRSILSLRHWRANRTIFLRTGLKKGPIEPDSSWFLPQFPSHQAVNRGRFFRPVLGHVFRSVIFQNFFFSKRRHVPNKKKKNNSLVTTYDKSSWVTKHNFSYRKLRFTSNQRLSYKLSWVTKHIFWWLIRSYTS